MCSNGLSHLVACLCLIFNVVLLAACASANAQELSFTSVVGIIVSSRRHHQVAESVFTSTLPVLLAVLHLILLGLSGCSKANAKDWAFANRMYMVMLAEA